jgi:undecaprenyl-diphosphatase
MHYLQILLLALVQGAAELLPVSSSAHVIVAERLMRLDPASPEMTFLLVMLHTGTMFAVLVYFWPRWRARLFAAREAGGPSRFHFPAMALLATIVTGVFGLGLVLLLEKMVLPRLLHRDQAEVEELFRSLPLIGAALLAVGVFILVAGWRQVRHTGPAAETAPGEPFILVVGWRQVRHETTVVRPGAAVLIGLVQGLCLPFRGFSRSGATISTALCCGVSRALAEDFSFALAVLLTPPAVARELHRLWKAGALPSGGGLTEQLVPGLVGMVFSFLAGLVALKLLSAVLERGHWSYFGFYCVAAAVVVFVAAYLGL